MSTNDQIDQWHRPLNKSIRRTAVFGLLFLLLAGGGFGVWASTAPIASATVTRGTFVATGTNKQVQHLEGGIIKQILVNEGDKVEVGQVLVKLSDTSVGAELRRLELRRLTLLATRARLDAQRSDQKTFNFTYPGADDDPEFLATIHSQHALFEAYARRLENEKTILERRISALQEEIVGIEAQKNSSAQQLELMAQEVATSETMLAKGLTRLPQLLQLKRARFKLEGDVGEFIASISKARQRILETESEINNLQLKFQQETADEYRTVQSELDDVEERLKGARDIMRRLEIVAPVRGTVVKLNYHTAGGVITPGSQIMELLPTDEQLVVEAYVRPEDKDSVFPGLKTELRMTALSARTTPTIKGEVFYVSADTIEGKSPGEVYYIARVRVSDEELASLGNIKITPGMPAEVFIKTGERTLLQYIVRPIVDSFSRAFREG